MSKVHTDPGVISSATVKQNEPPSLGPTTITNPINKSVLPEGHQINDKEGTYTRKDYIENDINTCDTRVGIPLEILREYDFSYQTNRLFIAFIVYPDSLKETDLDTEDFISSQQSSRLFQSYFPYHVSDIRMGGIGTVSPTAISEESFLTVLPKYSKITDITTTIPGFYYKDFTNANISVFLKKWFGLLGWKGSPYNYMPYIKRAFKKHDSKLSTSLYKGNILICSFKQNTVKKVEESEAKKIVGYETTYQKSTSTATSYKDSLKIEHTTTTSTYTKSDTKPIEENYKFAHASYTLEECFLCLGVYPKSVSGIGDYSRSSNEIRNYDITWNVDFIMSNSKILNMAQSIVADYIKSLYQVKSFNEYSTIYDGSSSSGTKVEPPKVNTPDTISTIKNENKLADGTTVSTTKLVQQEPQKNETAFSDKIKNFFTKSAMS